METKVIKEVHIQNTQDGKCTVSIDYFNGDHEGDTFNSFEDATKFVVSKEDSMMEPKQAEDEIKEKMQEEVVKKTDETLARAEEKQNTLAAEA